MKNEIYKEHETDDIKVTSGKCYRHICPGTMTLESNICFICNYCGTSVAKESYYEWIKGADLEYGDDFENFPDYDYVYDEDGNDVPCNEYHCESYIKYHDGQYVCPYCDKVMTRMEFFDYIGAKPLGEKCLICDNNYPSCKEYCELYEE